ncbi:MAG: PH domain-containing protein [Anaerolineae bacterium]|nr:PH domain-containing protein [Anaerolineae bacterium]
MFQPGIFLPEKRSGLVFQIGLALFFLALSGLGFLMASQQEEGFYFMLWMAAALLFLPPAVLLIYRAYALFQARYVLEREGLRLRWGLRAEDIPISRIEWIRPVNELGFDLDFPLIRWPGALVGVETTDGLGPVEFMASDAERLLLVATPEKIYAISPEDTKNFLRQFQLMIELGSLSELPSFSAQPTVFMQQIWTDRFARLLILIGLGATFLLFIFVSVYIPTRPWVSLGFDAAGQPMPPGPPETLLLFPVLAGVLFGVDLGVGFYFYRREGSALLAYITWGSSVIIPVLLLLVLIRMLWI